MNVIETSYLFRYSGMDVLVKFTLCDIKVFQAGGRVDSVVWERKPDGPLSCRPSHASAHRFAVLARAVWAKDRREGRS